MSQGLWALVGFAPVLIAIATSDVRPLSRRVLVFLALMMPLVLTAVGVTYLKLQLERRVDTSAAHELLSSIEGATTPPPYVLYLRPFSLTGQVQVSQADPPRSVWERVSGEMRDPAIEALETRILKVVSSWGRLVALAGRGERTRTFFSRSASRIRLDEAIWRPKFRLLASSAQLIVTVPSSSPNCIWEIEQLKGQLMSKAVFILPAEVLKSRAFKQNRSLWADVRRHLERVGCTAPDEVDGGVAYRLLPDCTLGEVMRPFSLEHSDRAEAALRTLMQDAGTV